MFVHNYVHNNIFIVSEGVRFSIIVFSIFISLPSHHVQAIWFSWHQVFPLQNFLSFFIPSSSWLVFHVVLSIPTHTFFTEKSSFITNRWPNRWVVFVQFYQDLGPRPVVIQLSLVTLILVVDTSFSYLVFFSISSYSSMGEYILTLPFFTFPIYF